MRVDQKAVHWVVVTVGPKAVDWGGQRAKCVIQSIRHSINNKKE